MGVYGGFEWSVVLDGHGKGKHKLLDYLTNIEWGSVLCGESDVNVQCMFDGEHKVPFDTVQEGSTVSIVVVGDGKVKCYWIGDSTIRIYSGGSEIFRSSDHNTSNGRELSRIESYGDVKTTAGRTLNAIDGSNVEYVESHYFNFGMGEIINMTRCVGHDRMIHPVFDQAELEIGQSKITRVIVATDGLWDMMSESAEDMALLSTSPHTEIMKEAERRWGQQWNFHHDGRIYTGVRMDDVQRDDIAMSVYDVVP